MFDLGEARKHFADTYSALFSPVTLFIWVSFSVMAVSAGPFGTYDAMALPVRGVYWLSVVTLAIVMGFAVRATTVVLVGFDRPVRFDLTATCLMAAVFSPVVWLLRNWLDTVSTGAVVGFPSIFVNTFIMSLAVFVVRRQVPGAEPVNYRFMTQGQDAYGPRLMRRLPQETRGEIFRLSAKDHHVEVATSHGTTTLRMRLTDAIDEMEPVEGYCTHRSHWVAQAAITGIERENAHKIFVVLCNGDRVPVSRKYRPGLEEAGIVARAPKNGKVRSGAVKEQQGTSLSSIPGP